MFLIKDSIFTVILEKQIQEIFTERFVCGRHVSTHSHFSDPVRRDYIFIST